MSCYYRSLPRLIPELIVTSHSNSDVAIVSPWIENVTLHPPRLVGVKRNFSQNGIRLMDFIDLVTDELNLRIIFVIRPNQSSNRTFLQLFKKLDQKQVKVVNVVDLHAKLVVTPKLALETSSNVIHTSLFRNVENCTIIPNYLGNTKHYVNNKIGEFL